MARKSLSQAIKCSFCPISARWAQYYLEELKVDGESALTINGLVRILCTGKIQINGKSKINANGKPSNLVIFIDRQKIEDQKAGEVQLNGETVFSALVYAPYSKIEINGKSVATGSYFGSYTDANGEVIVNIKQNVPAAGGGLNASALKSNSTPTDFKLGNVYSYPNPAKAGQTPTLHIEVGQADTVEIKIFNIAAELVHTAALLNTPLTDKNTDGILEYEYTWPATNDTGDKVASGVYIYYIRAEKQGHTDITVINKCAIIK